MLQRKRLVAVIGRGPEVILFYCELNSRDGVLVRGSCDEVL